jgi:hypothetical protein
LRPLTPFQVIECSIGEDGQYRLSLILSGLPKTTNAGGRLHWAVKVREARSWKNLVNVATRNAKPPHPLKAATLALTRYSTREPDFDGLVSSFKHIIDGLVDAGIIADDKPSVIGQPAFYWHKVAPKNGHVLIQVCGPI